MTTVMARGTFDVVHPGHVHHLTGAAAVGSELYVIVARLQNVTHEPNPILSNEQRRETVEALAIVDEAVLGHPEDVFVPIDWIGPNVIVPGHDQHHDEDSLADALAARGHECRVERGSQADTDGGIITSSDTIVERVLDQRGRMQTEVRSPERRHQYL